MTTKKKKTRRKSSQNFKTPGFLKKIRKNNSMLEYLQRLTVLNPVGQHPSIPLNKPRRKGRFVRLAHAREEFKAPVFDKGKSVNQRKNKKRRLTRSKVRR